MDGPVITSRDMDPATSTVCISVTCTGKAIGAATKVRFGRVRTANAAGSELLPLPMFLRAEYWSNGFIKNTDDNCTQIPVPLAASGLVFYPITTKNQLPSGGTTASINGIGSGSGTISTASDYQLRLTAPGGNKYGYVDVQLNAPPWMQYGGHPRTARATYGKSRTGPGIYMREIHKFERGECLFFGFSVEFVYKMQQQKKKKYTSTPYSKTFKLLITFI